MAHCQTPLALVIHMPQTGDEGHQLSAADVVRISNTSSHLECVSTTTKNDFPRNGPAKSICVHCHGFCGHVHGCSAAGGGEYL